MCTYQKQYSDRYASGHMLIQIFLLLWYVESMLEDCPTFQLHDLRVRQFSPTVRGSKKDVPLTPGI
jgi:hypothetical protein